MKKDEENNIELDKDGLDDSVMVEEHQSDSIKKFKDKLKVAEEKAKEYLDGWQRERADFANLRRRDEESRIEFLKFVNQGLIKELMPILDSFNIAIGQGHNEMNPIYNQLLNVLKSHGLEEMELLGEEFDPRLHEGVGIIKTSDKNNDHKILEIVQKGYILSGKTIRPAKVRIGEFVSN